MYKENISVKKFATISGLSLFTIPYSNQLPTPTVKTTNIKSEISLVLLLFQIFITCGTKAIVVQKAAK